jgi:hypothetical protein
VGGDDPITLTSGADPVLPTNPHVLAIAGVLTATSVVGGTAAMALTQRHAVTAKPATTYVVAPAASTQTQPAAAQSHEIEEAD